MMSDREHVKQRLDAFTAATRRLSDFIANGGRAMSDKQSRETEMEQHQSQDEADLALGRSVRDLLLSDLLRLSNERNALLNERAAWREAEAELNLALEMKQQTIEQIRQGCEEDTARLNWLSRPENYDVEFVLSQAGYRIQQPQRIADTNRFEDVLLTSRDWPTLREALDDAIERDRG